MNILPSSRPPLHRLLTQLPPLSVSFLLFLLALATTVLVLACSPKSEPATGPIADQVAQSIASGTESFDHSEFSSLLASGVRGGLVDYDYVSAHRDQLDGYLETIASANLAQLQPAQLKAFLINAYNAYTIESILDHLPIDSIRQIDGVWDKATHTVGGLELTLDNIEHNILRPMFKDPRVHMAVNCASQSCAPLPNWAFDGDRLEQQLTDRTREFFANPKDLDVRDGRLEVSKLLDWYGDDFTNPEFQPRADSLVDFIRQRAPQAVREFIDSKKGKPELKFKDYDWALNRADS